MHVERSIVSIQPKQTRLIRAPLLDTNSRAKSDELEDDTKTSRFVEPFHINEDQRLTIKAVLDDLQISDEEGRRLFLLALEYEIGAFNQVVMEHTEPVALATPVATDEHLIAVGASARQLLELLTSAGEETSEALLGALNEGDLFKRRSDQDYLRSVACELERIATACDESASPAETQERPSNEASQKFIRMLANIYFECFETKPSPNAQEPFGRILNTVVEQTNLRVRCDQDFLKTALTSNPALQDQG